MIVINIMEKALLVFSVTFQIAKPQKIVAVG